MALRVSFSPRLRGQQEAVLSDAVFLRIVDTDKATVASGSSAGSRTFVLVTA